MQVAEVRLIDDAQEPQERSMVHHVTHIHVMAASNYILHATVGISADMWLPVGVVMDTGSAYNFTRRNALPKIGGKIYCKMRRTQSLGMSNMRFDCTCASAVRCTAFVLL